MSSKRALRDKSSNKKQSQTALSAHQLSRSLKLQNSKPKVSAFTLSNIQFTQSHHQIKSVQDINLQYVELYHNLFQGKKEEFHLFDSEMDQILGNKNKINQQQRYQLECMKVLKQIQVCVQRIRNAKSLGEDLEKIQEYFIGKKQMGESDEYPQRACQLIEHYQKVSNNLRQIEPIHERLKQREMGNGFNFEGREEGSLTRKERKFKNIQRKLRKVLEQQRYYESKCQIQEKLMEEIQCQIRKSQQIKSIMQMKLVGEQAKTDRMLRKTREKKGKDLMSVEKVSKMESKMRSKSTIKLSKPI